MKTLKRFWPLCAAAFLVLGLALSSQPAAAIPAPPPVAQADEAALAAVGKRLDNDDDSTRSVKVYKSTGCYDNPNLNDTKVIGPGRSTIEFGGWTAFNSFRVYVDSRIDVNVWTTEADAYSLWINVTTSSGVCRNFTTDNRRARVFGYPGIVNSTQTKTAPGMTEPIAGDTQPGKLGVAQATPVAAKFVDGIGYISGFYYPSPSRDYTGVHYPSHLHNCSMVERKTISTNEWKLVPNGATNCAAGSPKFWSIVDDTLVSNTQKIRLVNIGTGNGFELCSTKNKCLAM